MAMKDEDEKDSQFRNLKWALQALAVSPSQQLALFPDHVVKADELALDFENSASVVKGTYEPELTAQQREAMAAIDRRLAALSRFGAEYDPEIWTDAALSSDDRWAEVRRLAGAALEAFGWVVESPTLVR
jgi:hypothetical protein